MSEITETLLKKVKIVGLGAAGAGLSTLTFFVFNRFLITAQFSDLLFSSIFLALYLVILALQVMLLRRFTYIAPLVVLAVIAPLFIFWSYIYPQPSLFVVIGFMLFLLMTLIAVEYGSRLLRNTLKIHFFTIMFRVLPKALAGVLLCVSFLSYNHYVHLGNFSGDVAERWFQAALTTTEPVVHLWFPTITFDMSIEEAIAHMSETQLRRSKIDLLQQGINIDKLPPAARRGFIENIEVQFESMFERIEGGTLSKEQTLYSFIYGVVEREILSLSPTIQALGGAGVILMLFFALRGLAFVLYLPAAVVAFLLYKLSILIGFAYVTSEDRKQDIVVLS